MKKNNEVNLDKVDIKIKDKKEDLGFDKREIPKSRGRKPKKTTFEACKKHIIAQQIDEFYIESINQLFKNKEKGITNAHDLGASIYYTILYYSPEIPIDHPLTYLFMSLFQCSLDIVNVATSKPREVAKK